MFKSLLQFSLCTAMIFASVSCKEMLSVEDEVDNIRELKEFKLFLQMRRPGYQRSHDSKRENVQLPETGCAPYPEVVQVEPNVIGLKNTPQFATANRCRGACDLPLVLQRCEPIRRRIIPVKVISEDGKEYEVDVHDHVDCACSCQVKCNANQMHDDVKCKCTCKEKCQNGGMQNPDTCECTGQGKRREEISELTEY